VAEAREEAGARGTEELVVEGLVARSREPEASLARPVEAEPEASLARPVEAEPGASLARPAEAEPGASLARPVEAEPGAPGASLARLAVPGASRAPATKVLARV
jgi:hypothetical protein